MITQQIDSIESTFDVLKTRQNIRHSPAISNRSIMRNQSDIFYASIGLPHVLIDQLALRTIKNDS